MADIRQSLQQLLAQSTVHNQPSSLGIAANASFSQSSIFSSISAPPFLTVSTAPQHLLFCKTCLCPSQSLQFSPIFNFFLNFSSIFLQFSILSSILQLPSVAVSALGVPINVNSQFYLPHDTPLGLRGAGVLSPVPGYLVIR